MVGNTWLASFPKSGNTWTRAFLSNYLFGGDEPVSINDMHRYCAGDADVRYYKPFLPEAIEALTSREVYAARPDAHRMMVEQSDASTLVKIHNRRADYAGVPTIAPEQTFGVVYIVRNPLDTVVSYANHYGLDIETAIQALAADDLSLPASDHLIFQDIGSWSSHVRTWTSTRGVYMLLMFYEAMIQNPEKTFENLLSFLQVPVDQAKLKRSIEFSSFKALSSQEQQEGFSEGASAATGNFFRSGKVGGWRDFLNRNQVESIVRTHGRTMQQLRYLDDSGKLRI